MKAETFAVTFYTFLGAFIGALGGSVLGFITSYLDRKQRKSEMDAARLTDRQRAEARSLCNQIATFYRLEQEYIKEIQNHRGKGEISGIRNEFRSKVYDEGIARIELNDSEALAKKDSLFSN